MNQIAPGLEPIRVVGLCGSLRAGGLTRRALDLALAGAAEIGAETRVIDLSEYSLPFCDGRRDGSSYGPEVERLRREVGAAHGIVIATPEYHGSFSGVLKNALDLMGFDEFEGKLIGLVGVGGGAMGALNALNGLRTIGRSLHAWVVPEQVSVPDAGRVFVDDEPVADIWRERLAGVGRQVARFAFLHHSEHALEFLHLWEQAPVNPGARPVREAA